ncbi:hypothetical protein BJ742DRAFT_791139 [Cladochytrium replicatum]|nr:hypothetical protein BJ742DRAFT_791139 [Cladochytrium replicatum]
MSHQPPATATVVFVVSQPYVPVLLPSRPARKYPRFAQSRARAAAAQPRLRNANRIRALLAENAVRAIWVAWDDSAVCWDSDAALRRSLGAKFGDVSVLDEKAHGLVVVIGETWDYVEKFEAYSGWIRQVKQASDIRLLNSPETVEWNWNKRYLLELATKGGVNVIPTVVLEQPLENVEGEVTAAVKKVRAEKWFGGAKDGVIVKPVVSASGRGVKRLGKEELGQHLGSLWNAHSAAETNAVSDSAVMVQPYRREIEEGEISCLFFNGEFSHALRKVPRSGRFLVQNGRVEVVQSPKLEWIEKAREMLNAAVRVGNLSGMPFKARVDTIVIDGELWLMELELIEPELFYRYYDGVENFCNAITKLIQEQQ